MAILFHCPWDNADQWLAALQAALPNDEFRIYPDLGEVEEIDFATVWQLPHGVPSGLPNLLGVCSLGAGVDALVEDPDLPRNIPIARLVDPLMMDRMAEYVCAVVLHHHLGLDVYNEQQNRQIWRRNPTTDARDRTVALLGMGQMGRCCAERLGALGFKVIGWSRGPKKMDGVEDKPRYQGKGRDFRGRRGRPTQRKRYTRRSTNEPRPNRNGMPNKSTNMDESKRVMPASQSSAIIAAQKKMNMQHHSNPEGIESTRNNDPAARITTVSQPTKQGSITTESSVPLSVKVDSEPKKESDNFIKRVTGFFGKATKSEESSSSGPDS